MKIVRGLGIVLSVLALAFVTIFNINEMMYRNSGNRIDIYGYKLMTIDNKYDYYLVKNVTVDDVILYDNVSFRVNSTDLSTDKVKGKKNGCLKLTNDSTVVCNDDLEGKVVMKVSGARDLLLANKGSIIVLVVCIILLVIVFLWKPKDKKDVKIETKPKEKKEDSVVEIKTEPFEREKEVPKELENIPQEEPHKDPTVVIDTTPFREEIKEDVELPQPEEVNNDVKEVESYNVNANLPEQNNVQVPSDFMSRFERINENGPVEKVNVDQFAESYVPEEAISVPNKFEVTEEVAPYIGPSNEELEDVIVVPLRKQPEDDSLNDIIVVPYDKAMENRQAEVTNVFENNEPVDDYSQYSEVITVPLTYSTDRYDEYAEVIKVPVFRDKEDDYFETNVNNDIFGDTNINNSVEININDIKVDSTSEKVQVTPIYSSDVGLNDDVEIL